MSNASYTCSPLGEKIPQNLAAQKSSNFCHDLGQLHDLIANISGMQQDVISQNCKLQSFPYLYT